MFKFERINIMTLPDKLAFKQTIRYWDKAGTQGGGCFTAGVKMGIDNRDRVWILHVERGQWSMDEREEVIKKTAEMDGRKVPIWVEQEPGSGGKDSAEYTVKHTLIGYVCHADKVGASEGNKTVRAQPFSVQVNVGNVYMVPGEWNRDCLDELKFFPASKYKDQADACSGAFNKLSHPEPYIGTLNGSQRN
jgi:predicted phage terminase large subunit-like protein